MDLTYIVVFAVLLIAAVATGLATFAWSKWVRPWIETHSLQEEACIVVDAVEALLGRYCGEDKWRLALKKMQERGWNIDADKVVDALKAAWKNLDLAQLAAGDKLPEQEKVAEVDLEIMHWSLDQLKGFCSLNEVPCDGCLTREDYISAIEKAFFAVPSAICQADPDKAF